MSAISLQGNAGGTGTLTVAAPSTNTNQTLTLPDNTGTLLSTASTFAGTGPAFSYYATAGVVLTNNAGSKLTFATQIFDTTSGMYASSKFTPTVAGYYQINAVVAFTTIGASSNWISVYKNNSELYRGSRFPSTAAVSTSLIANTIVQCNGSTDYIEIFMFTNGGSFTTDSGLATSFSGALVRAA